MDLSTAGKRLGYARRYRGMTQVQLAAIAGFNQGQISTWERDRKKPHTATWKRLEGALGVAWYWLASGLETAPEPVIRRVRLTAADYRIPAEAWVEATPEQIARKISRKREK